jgi:hypothetical protein
MTMKEEWFAEVLELKGKNVITILMLYIMNLTRAFSAHFFSPFFLKNQKKGEDDFFVVWLLRSLSKE